MDRFEVDDLASLIEPLRTEAENKIKRELSGPLNVGKRLLYNAIMPLHVNITSESHQCCLEFLAEGNIRLKRNLDVNPDVIVVGEMETIRSLTIHGSTKMFEESERKGEISITSHTWKGEQAIQKVRDLLKSRQQ